jgi:hypothetical protein
VSVVCYRTGEAMRGGEDLLEMLDDAVVAARRAGHSVTGWNLQSGEGGFAVWLFDEHEEGQRSVMMLPELEAVAARSPGDSVLVTLGEAVVAAREAGHQVSGWNMQSGDGEVAVWLFFEDDEGQRPVFESVDVMSSAEAAARWCLMQARGEREPQEE